jgi:hypothetical protein
MRRAPALLSALLVLAACATGNEAPRTATLSGAQDAPGYVVVGIVEQNYKFGLVYSTQSVALNLTSPGHEPAVALRNGCGSLGGFIATRSCDLAGLGGIVLRLPAGTWTVAGATLAYHTLDGDHVLRGAVPPVTFALHPNEVVDLGTYVFASDADKQVMPLVRHAPDTALTRTTLAAYPGLQAAPVSYRGGATVP